MCDKFLSTCVLKGIKCFITSCLQVSKQRARNAEYNAMITHQKGPMKKSDDNRRKQVYPERRDRYDNEPEFEATLPIGDRTEEKVN